METKIKNTIITAVIVGIAIIGLLVVIGIAINNQKIAEEKAYNVHQEFIKTGDEIEKDNEERIKKLEAEYEKSQKELDELNNQ